MLSTISAPPRPSTSLAATAPAASGDADHDQQLRQQVGEELHDGPAQLIALALLYLDADGPQTSTIAGVVPGTIQCETRDRVPDLLRQALHDIRQISHGLMSPGFEQLALSDVIASAIDQHEARTGIRVHRQIADLPDTATEALKACTYRIVHEGLSNAFKHAHGVLPSVRATCSDAGLSIEVADTGPGIPAGMATLATALEPGAPVGLQTLRRQIGALNGNFEIVTAPGTGTRLVARFRLNERTAFHV